MDPNENLKEQRRLRAEMLKISESDEGTFLQRTAEYIELAAELADRVEELDDWLMKGGALPKAWALART